MPSSWMNKHPARNYVRVLTIPEVSHTSDICFNFAFYQLGTIYLSKSVLIYINCVYLMKKTVQKLIRFLLRALLKLTQMSSWLLTFMD